MIDERVLSYIKQHFPTTPTNQVAKKLHLSPYQVRSIAKKHRITKCPTYIKRQRKNLVKHRRKWYEKNIPDFKPTFEQEQIIFGSLLGDGYISKGAERSINFYYQEHFGEGQREYRKWKEEMLRNLNFKISGNYLRSPSHPYFTQLYNEVYKDNIKIINGTFLKKCTHPLFLTTLYLDDGCLSISYSYNKNKNIVYCHPSINLYTLNFTKEENEQLSQHLNKTFQTNFVLTNNPDGHGNMLTLNKESEVSHLLEIIKPYAKQITSVQYKTNIAENIRLKKEHIYKKFNERVTIKISSSNRRRKYNEDEIRMLIQLKRKGKTDKSIAEALGRTYWSVVYKIRELRNKGDL